MLPGAVLDLAKRLGVDTDTKAHCVTLTQSGDMRLSKGERRTQFYARQTIKVDDAGFEWRAAFGPFGSVSVTDAYREGAGYPSTA